MHVTTGGRYIYNHKTCGRCGGAIRSWSMAARTCYACQTCQVLPDRAALSPQRSKALKAATGTKVRAAPARSGARWCQLRLAWPEACVGSFAVQHCCGFE